MELLISIFNTFLYQHLPGHDFGLAIIVLTVLIRLIFYPLMVQSIKTQKNLQELQLKIQEIQQKYKTDQEQQTKEIIELYKKEKINPFAAFLPSLVQLPILIALFWVFMAFKEGLNPNQLNLLYPFVSPPDPLEKPMFLKLINLTQPSLFLAILAGIGQFFQIKIATPKIRKTKNSDKITRFSNIAQKQMLYFLPIFMVFILLRLPAAISLYWITTSLFSIGQQYLILKKQPQ